METLGDRTLCTGAADRYVKSPVFPKKTELFTAFLWELNRNQLQRLGNGWPFDVFDENNLWICNLFGKILS